MPGTFPNGCHIAEVEIDPETGETEIVSYVACDDVGNIINHQVVEGQMQGGVTQGAGHIFAEQTVYDAAGQLLTGSFMDYAMPRAGLVGGLTVTDFAVPTATNPLGAKGVGEGGVTGSMPCLMNAVMDALRQAGVKRFDMPASQAARLGGAAGGEGRQAGRAGRRAVKRASLYSSSRPQAPKEILVLKKRKANFKETLLKYRVPLLAAAPGAVALLFVLAQWAYRAESQQLTQEDIDTAVANSLDNAVLPSPATRAYEAVRGSVVRVTTFVDAPRDAQIEGGQGGEVPAGTGTGVVILDNGTILTNIHVVAGAKRIVVTFSDGLESEASVVGTRPEDDLAVLQAKTLPDDLQAATLQSTSGLSPGDHVTAVGFPFGIGPSVSSGVVSGLGREYRSPEGKRLLTNLIQFDAAVNPGNSGGPLVNASGEVVGIVTGILNPTEQRVFVGIGFAVPIENAALAVGVPPF